MKQPVLTIAIVAIAAMCIAYLLTQAGVQRAGRYHETPDVVMWMNDRARKEHEQWERDHAANDSGIVMFNPNPAPVFFDVNGKSVELGLRSDGVVIWRDKP